MLDKERNHLISHAFRKANITSIESEPTEAEIDDAAHHLNSMLQSWNNDGFRLFKIKTGYMPFIPKINEYSLATQAYKSIESIKVDRVDRIGATQIKLNTFSNIASGQKIIVVDDIKSNDDVISDVVWGTDDNNQITANIVLKDPLVYSVYANDAVFYGNFNIATTEVKTFAGSFATISFDNYTIPPAVGDIVFYNYNNNWRGATIASVDTVNKTITFSGDPIAEGNITNSIIVFGPSLFKSSLAEDYLVSPRKVVTEGFKKAPVYMCIPTGDTLGTIFDVEYSNLLTGEIVLKQPLEEGALLALGENKIIADVLYPSQEELSWSEFAGVLSIQQMDWGSVTDTSDLQTDDWGYVTDTAGTLLDWGTLTGAAEIRGFSKSYGTRYAVVTNEEQNVTNYYLFYNSGFGWQQVDMSWSNFTNFNLYTALGMSFIYDIDAGLYSVNEDTITGVYTATGVEKIINFGKKWYLVSPKQSGITRTVVETEDFVNFGEPYTITLDSIENPAEFKDRLFIGSTDTYVGDMKIFNDTGVYSEARCVIGDRLINLNTSRVCSYTKDGVNFYPMPMMLSNQTAWGYKDGCSFIAVYGILNGGLLSTQIFTANDFNPVWTPQVVVPGRVHDIFFDDTDAYFVSDVAVYSLKYRESINMPEALKAFAFGEQICRPQQVMNVMKYGFDNQVELPMNPLSLQEFTVLPSSGLGGEPVNYCFFRDAKDGKMMVWGTPNKFGEYLKFSYVEPLTLLEDARCAPDFPDEYYEAVEDGLAAELGIVYGLPLDRQQALVAKAEDSKEKAMLHDNEDTSYNIVPNQRWQ